MELTPSEFDNAVLEEMRLNKCYKEAAEFNASRRSERDNGMAMRAREEDYDDYAERYQERANEDMGGDADWELFDQLWADRFNSNDDMAELLAEVLGMAHDEALAWVEGRDTP